MTKDEPISTSAVIISMRNKGTDINSNLNTTLFNSHEITKEPINPNINVIAEFISVSGG